MQVSSQIQAPAALPPGTDSIGRWWTKHPVLEGYGEETNTAPAGIHISEGPDRSKWIHLLRQGACPNCLIHFDEILYRVHGNFEA